MYYIIYRVAKFGYKVVFLKNTEICSSCKNFSFSHNT